MTAILILLLSACSSTTPPTELAPNGTLVTKALTLYVNQTQSDLGDNLGTSPPEFSLSRINVNNLEPIYIGKLPAYHLRGTYNLTLNYSTQKVTQKDNPFDIYLQRQIEGKTWRLLKRAQDTAEDSPKWFSYLIQ